MNNEEFLNKKRKREISEEKIKNEKEDNEKETKRMKNIDNRENKCKK